MAMASLNYPLDLPESDTNKIELIETYKEWPWHRENINLISMILSTTRLFHC